jgi:hypothetical protein
MLKSAPQKLNCDPMDNLKTGPTKFQDGSHFGMHDSIVIKNRRKSDKVARSLSNDMIFEGNILLNTYS